MELVYKDNKNPPNPTPQNHSPMAWNSEMQGYVAALRNEIQEFPPECRDQYRRIVGISMIHTAVKVARQINAGERSISFYGNIDLDKDEFCISFKSSHIEDNDVE